MRRRVAARLIVVMLLVGGAGPASPGAARAGAVAYPAAQRAAAAPDPRQVTVRFIHLVSGLVQPTALAAPDDGTGRLFVVERRGTIRYYRDGRMRGTYLDIRSRVNDAGGEQGLLGLAFHRNFRSNPYFYVAYTKANGTLRVARYRVSSYLGKPSPAAEVGIIEIPHPGATNHNGGQLAFNRDGYLYIGTGDGGGGGDPNDNAQNRSRLLGKILRIDVDRSCGTRRYCIPPSNPYFGAQSWRQEIWAYGLRNPWKFSFDRADGYLWIGDVGQSRREEIDRIPYGTGGWNLGWNCYEGSLRYPGGRCLHGVTYRFPIREYGRNLGGTVIGGGVYRGPSYPALRGIYVYGDFVSGRVWGYRNGVNAQLGTFPGGGFKLTSFGENQPGNLYAVGYDGRLFRVAGYRR
jgi:glucose/arabinose dehydrogenase